MAWTFPLTAKELGDLSSKISLEIFERKRIPNPRASIMAWKGDCCIKTPPEMNAIAIPNVMELYVPIYEDEEKRKQLIQRSDDFGISISISSGYTEFIKTRIYNLTLLNTILGRCVENRVSEFAWAHWPNYEDKFKGKKGIDFNVFEEFNKEHSNQLYLEQRKLMEKLFVPA